MPRMDPDEGPPTLWEWRVFLTVAKFQSWDAASIQLGLKNKYVTERIVRRLSKKLGVDRLVVDFGDRIEVPEDYSTLVRDAEEAVSAVEGLSAERARHFKIRVDAYPAHVEAFAGEVIGKFESDNSGVFIEFVPKFGSARQAGGAGMLADLSQRRTDLVIAPLDGRALRGDTSTPWPTDLNPSESRTVQPDREPVWRLDAHRWALVAAVNVRNDRFLDQKLESGRVVPVSALASESGFGGPRVLASPKGHRSRDLLDLYQSTSRPFNIVETSEEPAALVALAEDSDRIAVIPSDSYLPSKWDAGLPGHWLALVDDEESETVLGGSYGIFWRETAQPLALVPLLRVLAWELHEAALRVEDGLNKEWRHYKWVDGSTR